MIHVVELNTLNAFKKGSQSKIFPSTKKENSLPIPIQNSQKMNTNHLSYDLTTHIIDPTKFSPPNEFMNKLKMRMNVHEMRNVLIREIA